MIADLSDWNDFKCSQLFDQISTNTKKVKTKECKETGKYPVVDQGASALAGYVDDETKLIELESPVCIFGDHTRAIKWIDFDFVPGADGTKVLQPKEFLNPRFFYFLLKSVYIEDKGYARHFKLLKDADVKVPSLDEQKRIADKLDSVLAKVEAAQARLDKIPTILKRFRQSVLAAATSGELTKDWREGSEFNFDNVVLKEVVKLDIGHAFKSKEFESEGVRLLRGQNIEPGSLRWSETKFFPESKLEKYSHLFINAGDIILAMDRPIVSAGLKLAKAKSSDLPCVLVQRVARFLPSGRIDNDFLYYALLSQDFSYYLLPNQTGSDIPHISGKQILSYSMKLPEIEEQKMIVEKTNELFEHAKTVEKQYNTAKARVDKLTQSILAKAFRGELLLSEVDTEVDEALQAAETVAV